MAELVISSKIGGGSPSISKIKRLPTEIIGQSGGVKIFPNDIEVMRRPIGSDMKVKRRKEMLPFTAAVGMLRACGAKMIFLDSRGAHDSVDDLLDRYNPIFKAVKEHPSAKPEYIGLHYASLRSVHREFVSLAHSEGIEPVCITTSSRATEEDYLDVGMKPHEYAERTTKVAYEMGYRTLQCAAVDAEVVKNVHDDVVIFGPGIVLDLSDENHLRRVLPEEVSEALDYGVIGGAIMDSAIPEQTAKRFHDRLAAR